MVIGNGWVGTSFLKTCVDRLEIRMKNGVAISKRLSKYNE